MPDMEGKPGGGITPPGGGGAGAPRTDPGLAADLKAMTALADNSRALTGMAETLARMERIVRESNKDYKDQGDSLRRILRDTSDLEFASIRIQKLEKSRGVALGATRTATAAYIKDLQKEYTILLNTLNTGKGAKKHVDDIRAALKQLDAALQRTERQNTDTWNATAIQTVNAEIKATSKSVAQLRQELTRVQTKGMIDGFKGVGKAIDDAFDNQFLSKLNRMPGIAGAMRGLKFSSQAKDAQTRIVKHRTEHVEHNQNVYAARAAEVKKQYGPMGVKRLREMGYAGQVGRGNYKSPEGGVNRHRVALGRATTPGGGTSAVARAASAMDAMSVKSMTVGQLIFGGGKKTGAPGAEGGGVAPLAAEAAATKATRRRHSKTGRFMGKSDYETEPGDAEGFIGPRLEPGDKKRRLGRIKQMRAGIRPDVSLDDVRETMTGSKGGWLEGLAQKGLEGKGGWAGKAASSLAAKGGGSVMAGVGEAAAATGSSAISSVMGIASKAAVPLAILGAIVSARDHIATENKKIAETLTGTGIMGVEQANRPGLGGTQFQGIRQTLLSTGATNASLYGQGMDQNTKILQTLGEGGWATGRSTNKAGGVDLGEAMAKPTSEGGGFWSAIMRNSVFHGGNMGFSQDTSVKLTMKLMEKFGQTTTQTEDFFVHLETLMHSTGISATKYLDVIDGITDQFSELNKSLGTTVDIMTKLGKSGRLTGDQIKDMMTEMQKPTGATTAQRMVFAGRMTKADLSTAVDSQNAIAAEQLTALRKAGLHVEVGKDGSITNMGDIQNSVGGMKEEDKIAASTAIQQAIPKYNQARMRARAYASGDKQLIAAQGNTMGEDQETASTTREGQYRMALATAGIRDRAHQDRIINGDQEALAQLQGNRKVLFALGEAQKSGQIGSDMDIFKWANARGKAGQAGTDEIMNMATNPSSDPATAAAERDLMEKLYKELHPKSGLTGSAAVDAFRGEATDPKTAGKLREQLSAMTTVIGQATHTDTLLSKAIKETEDSKASEDLRKSTLTQTRTTAEITASAFEYLFARVTTVLDKLGSKLTPDWNSDAKDKAETGAHDRISEKLQSEMRGLKGNDIEYDHAARDRQKHGWVDSATGKIDDGARTRDELFWAGKNKYGPVHGKELYQRGVDEIAGADGDTTKIASIFAPGSGGAAPAAIKAPQLDPGAQDAANAQLAKLGAANPTMNPRNAAALKGFQAGGATAAGQVAAPTSKTVVITGGARVLTTPGGTLGDQAKGADRVEIKPGDPGSEGYGD